MMVEVWSEAWQAKGLEGKRKLARRNMNVARAWKINRV